MPRITSIEQRIADQQFQTDEINTLEEANNEQGQRLHELGESHAGLQVKVAEIQRAARE